METYAFLLHVNDQGTSVEITDAEEMDVLVTAQLLRRLGGVGALRG